jgi:peptidoglycan/LPS O-acetylase OafA/YrhL
VGGKASKLQDAPVRIGNRLGYVPALDGVRGIAIVLVVLYHATGYPVGGNTGVDVFFVLSGFLITSLLLAEHAAEGAIDIQAFFIRRARRLFPALAALLVVYLAVTADWVGVARYGLYDGNVFQAFFERRPDVLAPLGPLWSLAQEEQFYLVWPLMLLLLLRARRPLLWLLALTASLVAYPASLAVGGASVSRLYLAPDTHADGLVVGAMLGAYRAGDVRFRIPPIFVAFTVTTAALVFALVCAGGSVGPWFESGLPIFELATVILLAEALRGGNLARCLSVAPLVSLGQISYSLYLFHRPLLAAFHWHDRPIAVALSVSCAWASYRWIETPLRRRRTAAPVRLPSESPA